LAFYVRRLAALDKDLTFHLQQNKTIAMVSLDQIPVEEQWEHVRWAVERYPCAAALDEQQLEAAIDRILVQSHPDNLGRRDGRKPRYELPTALIIAFDLFTEDPDDRLKLARDQADLLTKGYLEVADDYWANLADGHAVGMEEWKKTRLRATDFGMDDSYHDN
jgi:hypothetical protein